LNQFRVWAPKPAGVMLRAGGRDHEMRQASTGWWECDFAGTPGTDYQFVVDGQAVPDPRSPFQPLGVHGPSRTVDHEAFPWTDGRWNAPPLSSAIVYEIHIGTFTREGTFDSAIARLDHAAGLGITHIELMPVNEFSGQWGWGYDGVDLYAPHHHYGGPEGLKRLVDACHGRGLAVLLDVVYNHAGPSGSYLGRFGPYYHEARITPWGAAINLDGAGSHEVRRFICDNALMWLRDYHFDGLRIDAVHAMNDTSATHVLEQLSDEVSCLEAALGRSLVLIAESDLNDPRIVRCREAGGYGLHAQWNDDFHHSLHSVLTGERNGYYADFGGIGRLALCLRKAFVYTGGFSAYRGRAHGKPPNGIPGRRFLGYLQNHDQIGNRARGERSSHLMSTGRLMIGAALVMSAPFIPMLFQGEEWGASSPFLYFTQHEEEWLCDAVTRGRRREFARFGWRAEEIPDPQARRTFEDSKLDLDEIDRQPHKALLDWHKRLIRLRRTHSEWTDGRMEQVETQFDDDLGWLQVRRGSFVVACNFAGERRAVPVPALSEVLLASAPPVSDGPAATPGGIIHLQPESVAILRCP
jgi:maltooligosyltrehalose trehalohydrolase